MDHSLIGGGRDDRLSKLSDGVLGHILSFLPAKEAARAAVLSARWRDVFSSVHTVSLEQPKRPVSDGDDDPYQRHKIIPTPPFHNGVSAALLARHRRRGAAPIRALCVAFRQYFNTMHDHDSMVDQWISYAMHQAGKELHLDLRLRNLGDGEICGRGYSLRSAGNGLEHEHANTHDDSSENQAPRHTLPSTAAYVGISDDWEPEGGRWYTVPRGVFSCAALRTLCLGPCRLNPPAGATNLPSLETLLLSQVTDSGTKIRRLISGCPRLVDLTLEDCDGMRVLPVLDKRLRRLSLQCCHQLANLAIDSSELRSFEYRGVLPSHQSFLNIPGPGSRLSSCKVDLCGEELTSEVDLTRLIEFLDQFASTEHLHLTSARLGSGIGNHTLSKPFPAFSTLRHLELTGSLPHDDDTHGAGAAVARILEHAPNVEVLTLFFKARPRDNRDYMWGHVYKEEELVDAHHLRYDRCTVFPDAPPAPVPCLREINLVHYQGGNAQRMLAKFLLGNVARLDALYCGFAEGPLWIQNKLMDEIRGWAMGKIEPGEIMFM